MCPKLRTYVLNTITEPRWHISFRHYHCCNLPLETGRSKRRSGCTKENAVTFSSSTKRTTLSTSRLVHHTMSVLHRRVLMEVCDLEHSECKMLYAFLLTLLHLYLSETCITIASNKSVEIIQKNVKENTETQHRVDPHCDKTNPQQTLISFLSRCAKQQQ